MSAANAMPPGHLIPRVLGRPLEQAVRGSGVWLEDAQGRRYLDACSGGMVVNVGHGRPELARAASEALSRLTFVHGTMFSSPEVEELAARLAGLAPPEITRFFFMMSGTDAVEAALKLAYQVQQERGETRRHTLVSLWMSYHGLSLGALAASGRQLFRAPFQPMFRDAVHLPPPFCLRCAYGLSRPDCGTKCAHALEDTLNLLGPGAVYAFLAETVGGAALGANPPPPEYFPLVREICDRHGVLLIMDEVMCGLGRTGRWFAGQHYGVAPDLVTLGKGLAGGTMPISAVGTREEHLAVLARGSGTYLHGGTFTNHVVSAAVALATLNILEDEGLVESAGIMGRKLGEKLTARLAHSPHVGQVRGLGLMWGVELVRDKARLAPYPRGEHVGERVGEALFRRGVLSYIAGGMAPPDGDAIMLGPPFIVQEAELDLAVEALAGAIGDVLG
ncbi:MAG: aspartate aminotransferase family protein [Deltaproteobacteria bacterium]|nr:aspartate aminotransferase family protein [Deltaproteobacteria bacterium]